MLLRLGGICGALVVVIVLGGLAVALLNPVTKHYFTGDELTVELEPGRWYEVREEIPSRSPRVGTCTVGGPVDAQWDLAVKETRVRRGSTTQVQANVGLYRFRTDTAGQYTFVCRHDPGTSGSFYLLVPGTGPVAAGVVIVVAVAIFIPVTFATVIAGLVMRNRAQNRCGAGVQDAPPGSLVLGTRDAAPWPDDRAVRG